MLKPGSPSIRFGRCVYNPATKELQRDGLPVPLGRRATRVLQVLLEAEGELVSGEDILQRVWDGTIVEHNTVQAQVSALRRALGNDRGLLKTYSGRGYRLMTEAQHALTAAPDRALRSEIDSSDGRVSTNLPAPLSPLVGRDRSLEEIVQLLAGHRLVTLSGAGGIGKTRLVIEAARRSIQSFPGGVWLAELASLTDPDLVGPTVVSQVAGRPAFDASLGELAGSLGRRPVLIVLDNCEHLVDAATRAAQLLVHSNAFIHVVATSREPLRAGGEVVYRVSPLDVPRAGSQTFESLEAAGASKLFIERALLRRADLSDRADLLDAIGRIGRSLDGLPLAIELAAGRARSLGILEVAAHLDESLDVLRGGSRTALARHQTLRATLDWSHGLLEPLERVVFRRLAIFAGGFTGDAACRIASDDGMTEIQVLGHLADLVDKSLVTIEAGDTRVRYRLLETTRAFALEKLREADEADSIARRHAVFRLEALDRVEVQTRTPRHLSELAALRVELDNVRTALDWAFSPTGDLSVGFDLASRALPSMLDLLVGEECASRAALALASQGAVPDKTQELRLRTTLASASIYKDGPTVATMRMWEELLNRSRELADEAFEIRALWGHWTNSIYAGQPTSALQFAQSFEQMAQRTGSFDTAVLARRIIGISRHYRGELAAARNDLEAMIRQYVHGAHTVTMAGVLDHGTAARATLARTLWFQGFPDQAVAMMQTAVAEVIAQDHALAIWYVGIECALPLSLLVGDTTAGRRFLDLMADVSKRQPMRVLGATGEFFRALLRHDEQDPVALAAALQETLDRLHSMSFECYSADLSNRLAKLLGELGRFDEAIALTEGTLARIRETGERLWEPEILRTRGELCLGATRSQDASGAEAWLREAIDLARSQGALSLELRAATSLFRVLSASGRATEARTLLDATYRRFTEGQTTQDLVEAHELLGATAGSRPSANRIARKAREAKWVKV